MRKIVKKFFLAIFKNNYFILRYLFNELKEHKFFVFHNLYADNFHSFSLYKACHFLKSNNIQGDLYEFGVYKGKTARWLALFMSSSKFKNFFQESKLFLFDSFQGLPEPKGIDCDADKWKKEQFEITDKDLGLLKDELCTIISKDKVVIVKGLFSESLNRWQGKKKISLLHIDCDLYESAKCAFELVRNLFQEGTVVMLDDFYCFKGRKDRGEQRALYEFFDKNASFNISKWFSYGWHGQAFIVNKNPNN